MRAEQIPGNYVLLIMRYLKEGGKIFGYLVLTPIVFLIVYLAYAYSLGNLELGKEEEGMRTVYLVSNGVHTDICISAEADPELQGWFSPSTFHYNGTPEYLSFGWGDRAFYTSTPTWADLKVSTALKAAFVNSPTAMHVTMYDKEALNRKHVREIHLNEAQERKVCEWIKQSFSKEQSHIMMINCCDYAGDANRFYEAEGGYNLYMTCNEWVNRGLKFAELKHAAWAPFEWCLMDLYGTKCGIDG